MPLRRVPLLEPSSVRVQRSPSRRMTAWRRLTRCVVDRDVAVGAPTDRGDRPQHVVRPVAPHESGGHLGGRSRSGDGRGCGGRRGRPGRGGADGRGEASVDRGHAGTSSRIGLDLDADAAPARPTRGPARPWRAPPPDPGGRTRVPGRRSPCRRGGAAPGTPVGWPPGPARAGRGGASPRARCAGGGAGRAHGGSRRRRPPSGPRRPRPRTAAGRRRILATRKPASSPTTTATSVSTRREATAAPATGGARGGRGALPAARRRSVPSDVWKVTPRPTGPLVPTATRPTSCWPTAAPCTCGRSSRRRRAPRGLPRPAVAREHLLPLLQPPAHACTERDLERLTNVDYVDRMAFVGLIDGEHRRRGPLRPPARPARRRGRLLHRRLPRRPGHRHRAARVPRGRGARRGRDRVHRAGAPAEPPDAVGVQAGRASRSRATSPTA